jgi:hypothetical protein
MEAAREAAMDDRVMAAGPSATLVIQAFMGDLGPDPAEYLQYFYVDNERAQADTDGLLPELMRKVDGLCRDSCSGKEAQRIDLLFEWLEEARREGWVEHHSSRKRTDVPERYLPAHGGRGVTRVVVVTAHAG